jgi:hypothetical protein
MKPMRQLSFLPDAPARRTAKSKPGHAALPEPDGFLVDPEEKINSIDDALDHMGRELGRLGTVLNRVTDYGLLGSFSQLYGQHMTRYTDMLLKKKMLEDQPADPLLELLGPALDRLNQTVELEL